MRPLPLAVSTTCAMLLLACAATETAEPTSFEAQFQASAAATNPTAHLSGGEEVPATGSRGAGQATFHVSADGGAVRYRIQVANIENTIMAHIHLANAGANGPIVVWLRPTAPPPPAAVPGRFDGVYVTGTFTASNLVGLLAGQSLENLLEAMRDGGTYVNVHTSQFPGGEIRGQIRANDP